MTDLNEHRLRGLLRELAGANDSIRHETPAEQTARLDPYSPEAKQQREEQQ